MINLIPIRNYSEVFKEIPPEDSLTFIRRYPTDFMLLMLSKINAILFQEDDRNLQTIKIFTEVIFVHSDLNQEKLLEKLHNEGMEENNYFSSAAISALIKVCLENYIDPIPDQEEDPMELGHNLFKTILIFNEIHFSANKNDDLESFEGLFNLEMLQQNHLRKLRDRRFVVMLKFGFLSKFFSTNIIFQPYYIEFCKAFKVNTMWDLGRFFLNILFITTSKETTGLHIFNVAEINEKILDFFILKRDDIREKARLSFHMDIVPKPFYTISNDAVMVLDYNYLHYAIDQGTCYTFFQATTLKTKYNDNYASFKGVIGIEYFEKYLVKGLLEKIFSQRRHKIISTDHYQDFIVKTSTDNILILEVKMVDVHINTIENSEFKGFKKVLDENFLAKRVSSKQGNKGAFQILKQMDYLKSPTSNLRDLLSTKPAKRLNIYPILLYSDNNFDCNGVNEYVNAEMLDALDERRKHFQSVQPILMLNVNVFFEYFSLLKSNPNIFCNWINDYFKKIKRLNKKYNESKGPYTYLLMNQSFINFLGEKITENQTQENVDELSRSFMLDIPHYDSLST